MLRVNSKHPQRIALVDCNNFYVSCERVFHPKWNNRPVGVLSNNDGCIVARSNELKVAGIPMGAPYFKHKKQLEAMNAVVVSSNYALYGDMSARVMHTLGQLSPDIEVYSIDEAWLDLTGIPLDKLDAFCRDIVIRVQQNTGIPVSVGIASTKTLAKIASRVCKKNKMPGQVFNLGSAESLDAILAQIAVGDIWGIGRRWAEKLNQHRIYTALDLRNADIEAIRKRYSVVMERIIRELRGITCIEAEQSEPKKQIVASRSFGERVTSKTDLIQAVTLHASRAGEKLRFQESICRAIQVSIRSGRHNPNDPYYANSCVVRFPTATADSRKFIQAAKKGVERMFKPNIRYAKAGVMLFDISSNESVQDDLFGFGDSTVSDRLMQAVDMINHHYGSHTVFFASEGAYKSWAMKRNLMTQAFTTQWGEIPVVC